MKRLTLLFVVLLVLPFIPFTPYSQVNATSTVTTPSASTEGLGPSVDLSHQPLDRVWSRERMGYVRHQEIGYYGWDNSRSYMLDNDGDFYQWYQKPNGTSGVAEYDVIILFELDSPYTDLKQLSYDLRYDVSGGSITIDTGGLDIYTATGKTTVTLANQGTDYTSTLSLNSSYVVSERINGRIWVSIDGSAMVTLTIKLDQMRFEYNTVSETRRSAYEVAGGTIRYTVDFETWDYSVNTTLTVPSAWTFQDVNPDCEVTSDEFACLVPKTYEAIYTDDVLATANWELYWSSSFEGDDLFYSTGMDAIESEYVTVMDGVSSVWANDSAAGALWIEDTILPDGNYTIVWSMYGGVCGTVHRLFWWNGGWKNTVVTPVAGEWTTFMVNIEVVSSYAGRNWEFYYYHAFDVYVDGIAIYKSSVTTGETVTGTTNHIYPNGYTPATSTIMEYRCTSWFATWTEITTDELDGTWSISTSSWSPSAGTEYFETRNPDDTTNDVTSDSITYPFSLPSDWELHGTFSFSDKYGHCHVTTNYDASYTIYENESSVGSGSVTKYDDNIRWSTTNKKGVHIDVGIQFTITDYTGSKWINTSYDIAGETPLYVTDWGLEVTYEEVRIWVQTSWRNTTVSIIDEFEGTNTTKFIGETEATGIWTYEVPHEVGNHTIYVTMDGGADTITRTFNYDWRWDIDPDTDIGPGPAITYALQTIGLVQFWQSITLGLIAIGMITILVIVAVLRRKDKQSVYVDDEGRVFRKRRITKKKVKLKKVTHHDKDKSLYEQAEGLLEPDE